MSALSMACSLSVLRGDMDLLLIDGIGPFFEGYRKKRINWSKIPFDNLEISGQVDPLKCCAIEGNFSRFCKRVASIGYTAVTLDDVAHVADCEDYPRRLRDKIAAYQDFYARLFGIAGSHGLSVYLTTDIMFFTPEMEEHLGNRHERIIPFLCNTLDTLFDRFPALAGVITRIGESDALDVSGDFKSRLVIKTPREARSYIEAMLPVFERHRRHFIFRTWSVGAHSIGDLIWNRSTFGKVFDGIESDRLIISMKHGESDFFRFLPLNKQFYRSGHKKIVELQARREYEGFGEYPSFIGWDYERCYRELQYAENVVGAMVWCQTGGWTKFRRLTFLESSSIWNEINTYAIAKIFKEGRSAEGAVKGFYEERFGTGRWDKLLELLRLSDEVIKELLYVDDFARRKVFFRRLRVPPLLSVYWDNVLISYSMKRILRCFVREGEASIRQGFTALNKIRDMMQLAEELNFPVEDLCFQYDTFEILAHARRYYFAPYTEEVIAEISVLRKAYRAKYKRRYSVKLDFDHAPFTGSLITRGAAFFLRSQRGYRMIDHIFTLRLLSWIYPAIRLFSRKTVPGFARKSAMGIDAVFK